MRITTKGRYALRAITNLALNSIDTSKPKSIKNIAAEEDLSPEFLEQIFFKLKKSGIIESIRGPGGGFILSRSLSEITVKEVFLAVEEGLDITPCTTCEGNPEYICDRIETCIVQPTWHMISNHFTNLLDSITLEKVIAESKSKLQQPVA